MNRRTALLSSLLLGGLVPARLLAKKEGAAALLKDHPAAPASRADDEPRPNPSPRT